MNKLAAFSILIFTLLIFAFGTWQMFSGNMEAAFISLPFMIIVFLFVKGATGRRRE